MTVSDVVRYLETKAVLTAPVSREWGESEAAIDNIADLPEARRGSLCWLSKRRYENNPALTKEFPGALLIGPASAAGASVLPTNDPKLAFVLAANFCTGSTAVSEWIRGDAIGAVPPRVSDSARLGDGVFLGSDVVIEDEVVVGPNSCLQHVTIRKGSTIGANCSIGGPGFGLVWSDIDHWLRFPHVGRVEIEANVQIGNNSCVDRGALGDTRIRSGARIDNLVHIAHNADIGADALVIAHAMVAGSAVIGDRAWIAPNAAIMNQLTIGEGAVVGLGAVVLKSVEPRTTVVGNPAKVLESRNKTEERKA